MRNSLKILVVLCFILITSCKKDDPGISVHGGLTRIDYSVNNPMEMPNIVFEFNNVQNLEGNTLFSIDLTANESSNSLSLMIMLEDQFGHRNDIDPMILSEEEIVKDNTLHTYTFDLTDHLGSTTSNSDKIDLNRISKVLIFINAGLEGKVAEGSFWLDKVEFQVPI
jgi:hypothetical protein